MIGPYSYCMGQRCLMVNPGLAHMAIVWADSVYWWIQDWPIWLLYGPKVSIGESKISSYIYCMGQTCLLVNPRSAHMAIIWAKGVYWWIQDIPIIWAEPVYQWIQDQLICLLYGLSLSIGEFKICPYAYHMGWTCLSVNPRSVHIYIVWAKPVYWCIQCWSI